MSKFKNCSLGNPCRYSCITRNSVCKVGLEGTISNSLDSVTKTMRLGKLLGSGSYGDVYIDSSNSSIVHKVPKEVNDKVLLEHELVLSASKTGVSPKVYDLDSKTGRISMERISGQPMINLSVDSGGQPWELAYPPQVAKAAFESLAKLHDAGILHGDFHEENILIQEDGSAKIIDFGMSEFSSNRKTHLREMVDNIGYLLAYTEEAKQLIDYTDSIDFNSDFNADIKYQELLSKMRQAL